MSQLTFSILTKEKNDNIGKLSEANITTVPYNEKIIIARKIILLLHEMRN